MIPIEMTTPHSYSVSIHTTIQCRTVQSQYTIRQRERHSRTIWIGENTTVLHRTHLNTLLKLETLLRHQTWCQNGRMIAPNHPLDHFVSAVIGELMVSSSYSYIVASTVGLTSRCHLPMVISVDGLSTNSPSLDYSFPGIQYKPRQMTEELTISYLRP